jgi:hypothetical protein
MNRPFFEIMGWCAGCSLDKEPMTHKDIKAIVVPEKHTTFPAGRGSGGEQRKQPHINKKQQAARGNGAQ